MTALAARRNVKAKAFKWLDMAATALTYYSGGKVWLDPSTGLVTNVPSLKTHPIGVARIDPTTNASSQATVVASGGTVTVELDTEIYAVWYANSGSTDTLATTDVGSVCYAVDDQTVAKTGANGTRLVAGRVWAVDSTKGVLVEQLTDNRRLGGSHLPVVALAAFVSNDTAPADIVSGSILDCPTTGAASTISLPATPGDGTWCVITADGTKNAHTVTIRDVTTAITAALTASKRLAIACYAQGGKWFAIPAIGP